MNDGQGSPLTFDQVYQAAYLWMFHVGEPPSEIVERGPLAVELRSTALAAFVRECPDRPTRSRSDDERAPIPDRVLSRKRSRRRSVDLGWPDGCVCAPLRTAQVGDPRLWTSRPASPASSPRAYLGHRHDPEARNPCHGIGPRSCRPQPGIRHRHRSRCERCRGDERQIFGARKRAPSGGRSIDSDWLRPCIGASTASIEPPVPAPEPQ